MTRHAADPGTTLADRLAHPAPMTPVEVATVGHQLATELDAWHRSGSAHRGLEPAAVVVEAVPGGGVRTHLRPPVAPGAGDGRYRAPEQLSGRPVGPAADVYALGVVLLDGLVGAREQPTHVPDDLGSAWRYLLAGMVAASPADRPTAGTVASTLAQVPGVVPPAAPPTAPVPAADAAPRSKLLPGGAHVTPTPVELPRENRLTRLLPPVPGRRRQPREPDVRRPPGDGS